MDNKKLIVEYNCVQNEIQTKIELYNKLLTFTITTVVAVLAFAVSKDNPFLFLLPFCIIIPMSSHIAYYRMALVKLSAYLIVYIEPFLDGCKWETRNHQLISNISNKKRSLKEAIIMNCYDCLILSVVCYLLFLFYYINSKDFEYIMIFNIVWPLALIFYELMLTRRINSIHKKRKEWIEMWNTIKDTKI